MTGGWTVPLLLVAGGLGALARYGLSGWVQHRLDTTRPYGTVAVNLAGTALLATLIVLWRHELVPDPVVTVVGAGFFAGLTTFSTWMLETIHLADTGPAGRRAAILDLLGQLLAGVVVAAAIILTG